MKEETLKRQALKKELPKDIYFARLDVCNKLRNAREKRGLSVEEVAASVGVLPGSLVRLECGRFAPSLDQLCKVADFLGVKVDIIDPR